MSDVDQKPKLDLAQRICEALSRPTKPYTPATSEDMTGETISSVPPHLRHLHNLMEELAKEFETAKAALLAKADEYHAVHSVFSTSLSDHLPRTDEVRHVSIAPDWSVVTVHPDLDLEGPDEVELRFLISRSRLIDSIGA